MDRQKRLSQLTKMSLSARLFDVWIKKVNLKDGKTGKGLSKMWTSLRTQELDRLESQLMGRFEGPFSETFVTGDSFAKLLNVHSDMTITSLFIQCKTLILNTSLLIGLQYLRGIANYLVLKSRIIYFLAFNA